MTSGISVEQVIVDLRDNRLLLDLNRPLGGLNTTSATVDIGAFGRLIGVEIGGVYLVVAEAVPGSELQGRSVEIAVEIVREGRRVAIPRRGEGWELSFPSGNECWRHRNEQGQVVELCSIVATA